jgi:hypothetical protein
MSSLYLLILEINRDGQNVLYREHIAGSPKGWQREESGVDMGTPE